MNLYRLVSKDKMDGWKVTRTDETTTHAFCDGEWHKHEVL